MLKRKYFGMSRRQIMILAGIGILDIALCVYNVVDTDCL